MSKFLTGTTGRIHSTGEPEMCQVWPIYRLLLRWWVSSCWNIWPHGKVLQKATNQKATNQNSACSFYPELSHFFTFRGTSNWSGNSQWFSQLSSGCCARKSRHGPKKGLFHGHLVLHPGDLARRQVGSCCWIAMEFLRNPWLFHGKLWRNHANHAPFHSFSIVLMSFDAENLCKSQHCNPWTCSQAIVDHLSHWSPCIARFFGGWAIPIPVGCGHPRCSEWCISLFFGRIIWKHAEMSMEYPLNIHYKHP